MRGEKPIVRGLPLLGINTSFLQIYTNAKSMFQWRFDTITLQIPNIACRRHVRPKPGLPHLST